MMKEELLKDVEVGDFIKITKGIKTYKGTLMPHHRFSKDKIITLKREDGYNIGIEIDESTDVGLVRRKRKVTEEQLENFKLDEDKPFVSILGTGGTIASYVDYNTGAVHPAQSAEEMLYSNPEIGERCYPNVKILFSKLSEDIEPDDWVFIADKVLEEFDSGAGGVVIAHGTDTMGYTSAALSFLLKDIPKPVVLVGSQRSSDRPSSDAHLNLLAAIEVAKSNLSGVYVVMHEGLSEDRCAIHKGTKVRKMHTSRRDAFRSINAEPVGYIDPHNGHIEIDKEFTEKDGEFGKYGSIESEVALIYSNPSLSEDELKQAGKNKGIVIAGTGLGHIKTKLIPVIKELVDDGTKVAMTSQCLYGTVNDNVYSSGRKLIEAGVIPCGDMLPETALVKLMWALTLDEDVEEIMKSNISGEITERRVR
ncbi:MAG: Glu-tRNA(Gln) amidotransferase subunit GatD [Candidatus Saliniplasma sp.]